MAFHPLDTTTLILIIAEYLGVIAVLMFAWVNPRLRPRPLRFLYPRREGIISLVLYLLMAGFAWLARSGAIEPPGVPATANNPIGELQQRLFLAAAAILPVILALVVRRQPLLSTGWNQAMLRNSFRIGLALVFLTIFLRGKIFSLLNGVSREEITALLLGLAISLLEETIYRGYLQPRLIAWLGETGGWILTAGMFAVWSAIFGIMQNNTLPVIVVGLSLAQGLLLGWVARRSGHVLAPALYRAVSEWCFYLP